MNSTLTQFTYRFNIKRLGIVRVVSVERPAVRGFTALLAGVSADKSARLDSIASNRSRTALLGLAFALFVQALIFTHMLGTAVAAFPPPLCWPPSATDRATPAAPTATAYTTELCPPLREQGVAAMTTPVLMCGSEYRVCGRVPVRLATPA